jgi:hypothetical protein
MGYHDLNERPSLTLVPQDAESATDPVAAATEAITEPVQPQSQSHSKWLAPRIDLTRPIPPFLLPPPRPDKPMGTVSLSGGAWTIEAEPHVTEMAKRLFHGSRGLGAGRASIPATRRTMADLNWLLLRYPLAIRPEDEAAYADMLRAAQEHAETLVLAAEKPQRLAPKMLLPLLPYQEEGVAHLEINRRTLLADEPGLGKTPTSIGFLVHAQAWPALIVVPPHLIRQWPEEIEKFLGKGCTVHVIKGQKTYKLPLCHVYLMHYLLLTHWREALREARIGTIVFDEIQDLRHHDTAKYSAASEVASLAENVIGLSVGPESIVELRGGPFTGGWVGDIESAVRLASASAMHAAAGRSERFSVGPQMIEARGWTGHKFGWKPVVSFVRHECDRPLRRMMVSGRPLLLTDDHSIYALDRRGTLCARRACDLTPGSIVAMDDGRGWDDGAPPERLVDTVALMADVQNAQVLVDYSALDRHDLGLNIWQWRNVIREAKFGRRLPMATYLAHRTRLPSPSAVYVARTKQPQKIEARLRLSDWAYVLGFFLGDGWVSAGYRVAFSVEDARVESFCKILRALPGIDLSPIVRTLTDGGASKEIRVNNMAFARVLTQAMGLRSCHEKTIPGEWITSWPLATRRDLLRGLVDSDGHVSKRAFRRYFSTTSLMLAKHVLSLLRSLGVIGSYSTRPPTSGGKGAGGKTIEGRRPSYQVNWSAYAEDGRHDSYYGHRRRHRSSDGRLHEGTVRSSRILDTSPGYVYDLEMDGHPSFVADGVLVHNSGTPIHNHGAEIWSVLNILEYHCLGDRDQFTREYCTVHGGKIVSDPIKLGSYLRAEGLFLRRRKEDVLPDLPKKRRVVQNIGMDEGMYAPLIEQAVTAALAVRDAKGGFDASRLRQIAIEHSRQAVGVAKAPYVAAFVQTLLEAEEPVLLFAYHHSVFEEYMHRLADWKPVEISGRVPDIDDKRAAVKAFESGETNLCVLSLRAGAGLNLARARCVVFGELDWSPAVHTQCLSDDTQVLTRRGFLGRAEVRESDESAAFDMATGEVRFRPILRRIDRPLAAGESMCSVSSSIVDLRVTGGHRMVFRKRIGHEWSGWQIATAMELSEGMSGYEIPVSSEDIQGIPLIKGTLTMIAPCEAEPGERVWCVENDMGTIIVRRKGKVAVVGNCEDRAAGGLRAKGKDSVLAYYLVAPEGADREMQDHLGLKVSQFVGIMGDKGETEEDKVLAAKSAEQHMANLLGRLQGMGKLPKRSSALPKNDE